MANFNIGRWDFIRIKKKEIQGEVRERVIKQVKTKLFILMIMTKGIIKQLYVKFAELK
jgi:hypothetical protein